MEVEATPADGVVVIGAIRPADVLMIQTINSLYTFTVTEPASFFGFLTGGVVGGTPAEVFCVTPRLRVGSQATFIMDAAGCENFIRTSNIIGLTCIKSS